MEGEPTEEDLRAFVSAMLANLDKRLREPEVIEESIAMHREMWVAIYRLSSALDAPADRE